MAYGLWPNALEFDIWHATIVKNKGDLGAMIDKVGSNRQLMGQNT